MIIRELVNLIGFDIDEAQMHNVEASVKKLFDQISRAGQQFSFKVTAPIMTAAGMAVKEFTDRATAIAIINRQIENTGAVAGKTAKDLLDLSEALSAKSLYDNDAILKKVSSTLLTFDNIAGETFNDAARAAVDLAARWEIDLETAAFMVGRALNNPAEGLALLTKRYVQMTKDEKERLKVLVESGRTADAQRFIIEKINRSVGGMSEKIRDASSGFILFFNKVKDVLRGFGEILQPYFKAFYSHLTSMLDKLDNMSPTAKKALLMFAGIAAAIGPVLIALGTLGAMIPLISTGIGAISSVFAILANPVVLGIIAAIVSAIAALYLVIEDFMVYLRGGESIIGKFLEPWNELLPKLKSLFAPMVESIKTLFSDVVQYMRGVLQVLIGMLTGDADLIIKGIKNSVVGLVKFIWHFVKMFFEDIIFSITYIGTELIERIVKGIINWVKNMISSIIQEIMRIPLIDKVIKGAKNIIAGAGEFFAGSPIVAGPNVAAFKPAVGATNKNVNVQSTINMTVPAGTQQQQIAAVRQAAEDATTLAWNRHLRSTLLQVTP